MRGNKEPLVLSRERATQSKRWVTVLLACLLQTLEEVTPKATPAKGAKAKGGKKK